MPLEATPLSWLSLAALVLSLVAVVLAGLALARSGGGRRRVGRSPRRLPRGRRRPSREPLSPDRVTAEIEALQTDSATALRHVAVVRYDAFGDMGGHLSWSLALLDDTGDGVVLTSIHGRSDSRTYAKNVTGWSASQQLSPEEAEAIGFARAPQ
ncbi:MAG: DUF4446 family protein [Actinomycetota bacterium]|jgi:Protein of unknown function (DUF4446)|nr:DUF4446 family protein [Actinomycetota bacterium]